MRGEDLRNILKGSGKGMGFIAESLGMTRQNLNHHLRKDLVDEALLLLVEDKLKINFQNGNFVSEPIVNYGKANVAGMTNGDYKLMHVPFINKFAYAGYLSGYGDAEYVDGLPKYGFVVDKEYKGNYIAMEVKGDSMDDGTRAGYLEGDILLCREIPRHHWKDKLHIKKWDFVVVTKDGILLKKITEHNTSTGDITLRSLNELYDDINLNLDDVVQLFNVVQVSIKR